MKGKPTIDSKRYDNRRKILALLTEKKLTIIQIAFETGMSESGVRRQVKIMHEAKPKQIHICGWVRRVGGCGGDGGAAVYKAGNRPDAKFNVKQWRKDVLDRYNEKYGTVNKLKAMAKRGTLNHYMQLVQP